MMDLLAADKRFRRQAADCESNWAQRRPTSDLDVRHGTVCAPDRARIHPQAVAARDPAKRGPVVEQRPVAEVVAAA